MINVEFLSVYISIFLGFVGFVHLTRKNNQHLMFFLASLVVLLPTLETSYSVALTSVCIGVILRALYERLGKKGD